MIFVNSASGNYLTPGATPYGLFSYALDHSLVQPSPAHLIIVQNIGTSKALLGNSTGAHGYELAAGKDFRMNVPAGIELFAWNPLADGTVQLHVMAIVE